MHLYAHSGQDSTAASFEEAIKSAGSKIDVDNDLPSPPRSTARAAPDLLTLPFDTPHRRSKDGEDHSGNFHINLNDEHMRKARESGSFVSEDVVEVLSFMIHRNFRKAMTSNPVLTMLGDRVLVVSTHEWLRLIKPDADMKHLSEKFGCQNAYDYDLVYFPTFPSTGTL